MRGVVLLCLVGLPWSAFACKCQVSQSVCHETASSDVVFIGTVESVEPAFLDPWSVAHRPSLAMLNRQSESLQDESSGVAQMRQSMAEVFSDVSANHRQQLAGAKAPGDLVSMFYSILTEGRKAHFKVKSAFRGEPDEDEEVDVWTSFDDCGVDFQIGETYLVFADDDEEAGRIETDRCSRTRRLTDAGADLAYLYFYRDSAHAGRVEGFVTSNVLYQRDLDPLHDPESIASPAAEAVVGLASPKGARYTVTDAGGRFLFDGLAGGTYQVSAYAKGYPTTVDQLAGPKEVEVAEKGCANTVLVALPATGAHVP